MTTNIDITENTDSDIQNKSIAHSDIDKQIEPIKPSESKKIIENLEDVMMKTILYKADGTELSISYQTFIDKMGGEFGNNFVMVNDDGDMEYFIYTTRLERYTQRVSAVGDEL